MLLGEFLHSQIKKAGMNPEDEAIKGFLLNGELMKIELPEDIEKGIDSNLISLKDAKNNHPEIKSHYTQQSLMTVDKTIEKLLEDMELDDATKADILSETSTYKRVPKLAQKIRELEVMKAAAGKTDKAAFQKQIDDLHAAVRAEKERADKAKEEFEGKLKDFKLQNKIRSLFGAYKTVWDELDPEVRNSTISNLLQKELQDSKAVLTFDENENLTLLNKDGANFYGDNNQQVNPQQFLDIILSKNKVLVTSQKSDKKDNPTNTTSGQQPQNGGGNNNNNYIKSLVASSMKDMQNSSQVPIM